MTPTILEITDGAAIVRRPVTDGDHARAADLDCTVAGLPYAEACDGESIVERVSLADVAGRWPSLACGHGYVVPAERCEDCEATDAEDEAAWRAQCAAGWR